MEAHNGTPEPEVLDMTNAGNLTELAAPKTPTMTDVLAFLERYDALGKFHEAEHHAYRRYRDEVASVEDWLKADEAARVEQLVLRRALGHMLIALASKANAAP